MAKDMYVDLKLLRLEHDNMFQSELGELLGVGQSVISRMERQFAELNDVQYKKLCERFGEEEVQKYVKESPLKRTRVRAKRKNRTTPAEIQEQKKPQQSKEKDTKDLINSLYKIIEEQNETIVNLSRVILQISKK